VFANTMALVGPSECVPLTQPLKFDTASDIGKIVS
jgi:hypothetical protein